MRTPQHRLIHLQRLLTTPGWRLEAAAAINDHLWIVGSGCLPGELRAYLLRHTSN